MFLRSKLRQSHAIVFAVFQTVFLRCFGVAFHPLAPTLVKENFFKLTDYLFCFRDIVNYIYIYIYIYKHYDFIYFSKGVSGRSRIQNDSFPEDFC